MTIKKVGTNRFETVFCGQSSTYTGEEERRKGRGEQKENSGKPTIRDPKKGSLSRDCAPQQDSTYLVVVVSTKGLLLS